VASAATAVAQIVGKAVPEGKLCYYIALLLHRFATTSMTAFITPIGHDLRSRAVPLEEFQERSHPDLLRLWPHVRRLDTISLAEQLPDMEIGDLVYSENIGAYSAASSTFFNGFPPAKVVHVHE
jgi:ornithine decarboxylase